jgi:DNA-binding NarL/FixJ family response regulator
MRSLRGGHVTSSPVRTLLVDEAGLIHEALRSLLARSGGFVVVGAAREAREGLRLARTTRAELVVCEAAISGESGVELCRRVRGLSEQIAVVLLSGVDDPELARAALGVGASGYLLKTSPPEEIVVALAKAARGVVVLDPRLGRTRTLPPALQTKAPVPLSPREREVLAEIVRGLDNRGIAARLCISEETVKTHVKAILRKLKAGSRAQVMAMALGTHLPPGQVPRVPELGPAGRPAV